MQIELNDLVLQVFANKISIDNYRADERRTKMRFDSNSQAHVHDIDPWPRQPEDGPIPLFGNFPDTRKEAKSLECRNRGIQDAWDNYDSIFYNAWRQVSIEPTRFVNLGVVRALGIRSDLEDLFVELGMGNFATHPQVLYPELVLGDGIRLVRLPLRSLTDFSNGLSSIQFRPDPRLIRAQVAQPRHYMSMLLLPSRLECRDVIARAGGVYELAHRQQQDHPASAETPPLSVGSDLMARNHGLSRFRNDVHGLSRAVHGQDPYDLGRFIGF
ncbi:hypothetical protein F2Q69_00006546 [Brassica cretica]|uniref:Uncharacterized protein n=1 Tax=Brassica cretica TaxID=69181 RepID=A0A8S9NR97_BRACR|nr:hypothetical protein F2Q69_00006546 [Brassica cretica]